MPRLALALLLIASPVVAQDPPNSTPLVVMTGQSVVRRAPDVAHVTAAVESRAKSPRDAQRQNADAMAHVRRQLAALGIGNDTLRTRGVSLEQEFENANGRPVLRGYVARNSVEVTLDDVTRVGEVADAVVQAGATSLGGIRFDLRDRASAEQEAVRLAVADARGRAEAAAAGAGRTIDRIVRIEDSRFESMPRPMQLMRAAESAVGTPVDPGVIEIRAQVVLTASMK